MWRPAVKLPADVVVAGRAAGSGGLDGFLHLTPLSNDRELRGQIDQAITAHAYPPTVWSAGEVVEDHVQKIVANLHAGRYAVWMGLYSPATQVRVAVEAGAGEVIEGRVRLLEFQIGP